jgi:hypothetical protein
MSPNEPYLNCYIWEIKQYPRFGKEFKHFLINDFYPYNSLTDLKEDKQLSPYIQVPEVFVKCSETDKQLILENLKYIVDGKIPIIKNINDESWEIDLTFFKGEK